MDLNNLCSWSRFSFSYFWVLVDARCLKKKKKIIFLVNSVCVRVCERQRERERERERGREAANINIFKQTTLTNHKSYT